MRVVLTAMAILIEASCCSSTTFAPSGITCKVGADGREECKATYDSEDGSSDDISSSSDDDEDDDNEDEGDWWTALTEISFERGSKLPKCTNHLNKCSKVTLKKCERNPGYMKYACPLACDMCDEFESSMKKKNKAVDSTLCMDYHEKCKDWAAMGECEHNPNYMHRKCSRSCMRCYEDTTQFGVKQNLPSKDDEFYEATVQVIQNTKKYMIELWANEESNNYNYKCRNLDGDCSYYISGASGNNDCETNRNYMLTNCAPVCQLCHLLDIRLRCPKLPGNEPIMKPGDLNTLFENIVDNADGKGEYIKYNPKALSRPKLKSDGASADGVAVDGPWIVMMENFVSDEEAEALIAAGANKGYERSSDVGTENPDGTHEISVNHGRTSTNAWCDEELCEKDPIINPVIMRIAEVTKTHPDNSEDLQLLRYEPGQYYNQHHDYIEYQQHLPSGVRMLTLFLYLNDVEEGGETNFPKVDVTVQPKKGSALLWPSVLDEDPEKKDFRTDHEALPVLKGIKYGKVDVVVLLLCHRSLIDY
jgi:prolyl 4-hydroxylase